MTFLAWAVFGAWSLAALAALVVLLLAALAALVSAIATDEGVKDELTPDPGGVMLAAFAFAFSLERVAALWPW